VTSEIRAADLTLAFSLLIDLGMKHKAGPLNKHENCWEHRIDDQWFVAMNGHPEHRMAKGPDGGMSDVTVPPYQAAIWFNGWLAGLIGPFDGILAAGEAANEDAFIDALKKSVALLEEAAK